MGVRELIWGLIVLLALYIVWQLYRALRPGRKPADAARPVAAADDVAAAKPASASAGDDEGDDEFEAYAPAPPPKAAAAAPAAGNELFQLELEVQQLRRDLAQIRAEQQAQRQQLAALGEALQAAQEQLEARNSGQSVSPEYDEALVFARRGLDADAIAERCGISVSEAQLVLSLARGGPSDQREGA